MNRYSAPGTHRLGPGRLSPTRSPPSSQTFASFLHVVFRIHSRTNTPFERFILSPDHDRLVELSPTNAYPHPRCVRLLECPEHSRVLATTLTDPHRYTPRRLADLYHGRWSIEELYKLSKQLVELEPFHAHSERGVRQELYAHLTLIALTRLFSNRCDAILSTDASTRQPVRTHFKNNLRVVARTLEGLFLEHAAIVADTVRHIMARLVDCLHTQRPGRSYPRISRKPIGKWKPPKPA